MLTLIFEVFPTKQLSVWKFKFEQKQISSASVYISHKKHRSQPFSIKVFFLNIIIFCLLIVSNSAMYFQWSLCPYLSVQPLKIGLIKCASVSDTWFSIDIVIGKNKILMRF